MGYTRQAIHGFTWMGILRASTRVVAFLRIAIIARLLTPSQFGLYGIAALVLSFLEVITEAGINIFIIQEKEDLKKIVNTAWIISILRGFIIFLFILISSPLVVKFFDSPDALFLILLISLVPLIKGFINPSIIKFQKDLEFKKEFYFRSFIFISESVLAVLFVYVLSNSAGIIYGLIAGAVLEVIISFILVDPKPKFQFDNSQAKRIVSRGKWITASGISNYFYHNADDAVVGRVLGVASLGLYDMAYKISMLPITEMAQTISKVVFPVFTQISDDLIRLRKAFLKTLAFSAIISIPIGIVFFVFAEQIVRIILGTQWLGAVPVFKILAGFAVLRTMLDPFYSLYLSLKKQEYNTVATTVSFIVMIITIIPLINIYGLQGAAISVVFGSLAAVPIVLYFTFKIFMSSK